MFYDHHHRHHPRRLRFLARWAARRPHSFGPGFEGADFTSQGLLGRRGGGFRFGRKLGAADLQLLILALLAERPSYGYELIKQLEQRSGGFYSPSPGMVYPALTYLEEIGYATVAAEGAKKLYHITDAGRAHLERNRASTDAILATLERIGGRMERVRRAFAGDAPLQEAGREAGDARADANADATGLGGARHALRSALHQALHRARHRDRDAREREAQRIAAILWQAAREILGR